MKIIVLLIGIVLSCAAAAYAELPAGLKFDDGFAWFECKNFDSVENHLAVGRWVLVANVRILGRVPDRSGWKFVVKKDGKALAEYVNDGFPGALGSQPVMTIVGFWKQKPQIDADGLMDVEVYYIDGKTDKEHLARTCRIDVRRAEKERGSVGRREAGPASFYVNRHAEVLSSILYFRDSTFPSYTGMSGLDTYSDRVVELLLNYCENEDFAGPKLGRLRVEVNGREIDLKVPNNEVMQDQMAYGQQAGKYNVEHSDRAAEKYFKSGPPYKERIGFARRVMILPLYWGPKPPSRPADKVFTTDHPGEWKVTYVIDRKPVRIYRFTIGKDGLPKPHEEQTRGLTLAPNAVLIETEIPGEGGEFDGRLTNEFVKQGAFYGRPWESAGMKHRAEQVPTKGRPFPVPSDKQ